jgi:WD40 repeat protein
LPIEPAQNHPTIHPLIQLSHPGQPIAMAPADPELSPLWQISLSDYISALTWPDTILAATTVTGELTTIGPCGTPLTIRHPDGQSIDALAFSADRRYLAAAGQMGLLLWRCLGNQFEPIAPPPDSNGQWIEQITWHPSLPILAYGQGRTVPILDLEANQLIATLAIETASVTALAWHPSGEQLAVGGYRKLSIWGSKNWTKPPLELPIGSVSLSLDWSADGTYLASGNLDRNLNIWRWGEAAPWQMRGFPGKVRRVRWSKATNGNGLPYLAVCSQDGVVIWSKDDDDNQGWNSTVLELHQGRVNAVSFGPKSQSETLELASAGEDGWLCLWQDGEPIAVLEHDSAVVATYWQSIGLVTATAEGILSLWPVDL